MIVRHFIKGYVNKMLYKRKALRYINVAHRYLQTQALGDSSLTDDERCQIDKLWGTLRVGLGDKTYDWHKFYKGFLGEFDAKYIPSDIYNPVFEYTLNDRRFSLYLQHKSMLRNFVKKENRIEAIVDLIDGVFYDDNLNIVSLSDAEEAIKTEQYPVIVKPSIGSGGGRAVEYFDKGVDVNLADYVGVGDFSFQKFFREGEDLKRFNPDTVNTIRMITLNLNGRCSVLSSFLRIGKGGMRIDNLSSGGMLVGINKDGYLADYALDKNLNKFTQSPSGISFKGVRLSSYQTIVDYALQNHPHIPLAKLIAWDFTIDENGNPIVIEINLDSGEIQFHQIYNGPLFGDRLEEVVKYITTHPLKRFSTF